MNDTRPPGGGPASSQSNAETLSGRPPTLGGWMASRGSEWTEGAGAIPEGNALGPPVFGASSSLMYEHKSITPDATRVYEGNLEIVSEANGPRGIQGFPDRIKRFATRHVRAEEMASFLQLQEQPYARRRARKLRECGRYLTFRHYFTIDELRLHEAFFCQQSKLCPLCAVRRGAKMLRRYTERVLLILADRPELKMYVTTLTVRNGPDLAERMNHITNSLARLTLNRRQHWNNDQAWSESCCAIGSVGSFEIKRGRNSQEWHPHFHDAWLCDVEPDEGALAQEWLRITGDSHVVNITPFHYVRDGEPATAETVARDFSEVFKYALKFQELSFADNWHAAQELHGRRLVRSFGALFGVKIPDDLADDPLDDEDLPYVELFYRFQGGAYELEHHTGEVPS